MIFFLPFFLVYLFFAALHAVAVLGDLLAAAGCTAVGATAALVFVHVWIEARGGLGTYLYRRCGREQAPPWVSALLTVGAVALVGGPLVAWIWTATPFWATWLSAAIVTDAASTHVLPTVVTRKPSPGVSTWAFQLTVGLWWGHVGGFNPSAIVLGAASFAAVWPTVFIVSRIQPFAVTP